MIGNPRYGIVGMGVLPYIAIFEGLGPLIELLGYVVTTVAFFLGMLNWQHYRVMLATSILFGAATTLVSVFLSDVSTRKYLRLSDLADCRVGHSRERRLPPVEFVVGVRRNGASDDRQRRMGPDDA